MSFFKQLFGEKPKSAHIARERLMFMIAHERADGSTQPDFLPKLRDELIAVISKYVKVNEDAVKFNVQKQDNMEILEVNIALPEKK